MTPAVVRVLDNQRETHDTFTLVVEPPRKGWSFLPGQFNMLYAFGVGEAAISLSGDPFERETVRHTIRAVGSVTQALQKIKAGDSIGLRGPFGSSWPLHEAGGRDVVIVAGGIGMAPLRPAIYHILRQRSTFGRVVLLYGVRTPDDLLFASELDQWNGQDHFQVLTTADKADAQWKGTVGLVTDLFTRAKFNPSNAVGLMCGPEVMMRFSQRQFHRNQVPDDRIYLTLERNMQCAVGFCGHCQLGPEFICMDGPVFRYDKVSKFFNQREA
ncbi:MAG: FAD/NAD(P)-binding protein [Planctomycetes bacterium]|nr:FAD/NAD(P)-binding protein [Planctomycetota bacterium]